MQTTLLGTNGRHLYAGLLTTTLEKKLGYH